MDLDLLGGGGGLKVQNALAYCSRGKFYKSGALYGALHKVDLDLLGDGGGVKVQNTLAYCNGKKVLSYWLRRRLNLKIFVMIFLFLVLHAST